MSGRLMYGPVCPYQPKSPKPQDTIWKLYMTVLQTGTVKILPAQICRNHIALMCIGFMSYRMCKVWMISWVIMIGKTHCRLVPFVPDRRSSGTTWYFIKYNDERTPDVLAYMADSLVAKLKYGHELMFEKLLKMINETPIKTKTVSYQHAEIYRSTPEFMYNGLVDLANQLVPGLKCMFDTLCDYYERIPVDTNCIC